MRADEKEKLLKEIDIKEEAQGTRSMYFRIGKSAYKTISELAEISGSNKSDVVRKLVTRALTGKEIEIGKETQSVKLDWLVRDSKRNKLDIDALKKGVEDIRKRLETIDSSASETTDKFQTLLVEIYCLLYVIFSAENQSLSRLIELTAKTVDEHTYSIDIANLGMARFMAGSLRDLEGLAKFHKLKIGGANYTAAKIEVIEKHVAERRRQTADPRS
jgi:hypothetical protein